MKLKSFLLMALAATTTLAACDKSEDSGANPDQKPKSVTVTLPNLDTSRATGDAQAATTASLKNLKIFFMKGDSPLEVNEIPQYNGVAQPIFFGEKTDGTTANAIPANGSFTYHFLPASVTGVVVVGNVGDAEYATAIGDKAVLNDGDTSNGTDDNGHPYYPLYGKSNLTLKSGTDGDGHNNVYTASVEIAPRIARFEIYGFEYAQNGSNAFIYDALKLDKIALSNYYTKYNLATGEAVTTTANEPVACPSETAKIWDWINGATWANKFTEFTLNKEEKVYVTNNTKGNAIPASDTQGDNAQKIVTYGLTKVTDADNNPELLLAFYGTKTGQQDTPHYLRGKFTSVEAFQPGKIYRVLFKITDGTWEQPERCIELTVTVKSWVIVPVSPEFN